MLWNDLSSAPCHSHHVDRSGYPAYEARFDEVLKFHAPGLAAVRREDDAWHIRSDGSAAYSQRFRRAFGFYENLAAVVSANGWHHIHPDGSHLATTRYDWCGNFQGGRCTARLSDGTYLHITNEGVPAYAQRWCYAGDFRDGVAVVQADDGRSTHIDVQGNLVHSAWFLDLDVFHKGFARARTEDGWTHINAQGRALYAQRFANVEPFYNGQARVEGADGALEVIDEQAQTLTVLRPALRSPFARLSADLVGFWRTQTICAAVELGLFESLPGTAEEVARACSLDRFRAQRLLCALAELGLAASDGTAWHTTEGGNYLQAGHPLTLAGAAVEYGRYFPEMWATLPAAISAGTNWQAPDIFAEVASDAARTSSHHQMLTSYARHDYAAVPAALALQGADRVVDAGGGTGTLAGLLVQAYPDLAVVVLERPEVVGLVTGQAVDDRVSFRAADLFKPWNIEADAVVMARVLHDWNDAAALQLLQRARQALRRGGRLFVVEMLLTEDEAAGSLCDLHLLMATGGQERSKSEYSALLEEAGFAVDGVRRLPALPSVLVGVVQ